MMMNLPLLLLQRQTQQQLLLFQRRGLLTITRTACGCVGCVGGGGLAYRFLSSYGSSSSSSRYDPSPVAQQYQQRRRLFSSSVSSTTVDDDDNNNIPTISKDQQEEIEWKQRCELASCYRISYLNGWHENIFNHITFKVANSDNDNFLTTTSKGKGDGGPYFFINEFGIGFDEMTASNIIKVNLDGEVVDSGSNKKVFKPGYVIHSAIHQGRPDVHAIWHVHPLDTTAVCQTKFGLLPISQEASLAAKRGISYHPFEGTANNIEERSRLVKSLGPVNQILMLENHGPLLASKTLAQAFAGMFFLTRACTFQIKSLSSVGGDISKIHMPDLSTQDEMLQRSKKFDDAPTKGQTHDSDLLMYQYAIRNAENVFGSNNIYK